MRAQSLMCGFLAATLAVTSLPVRAEMVGTPELLTPAADAGRENVDAFLAREDVREQLVAFGVDPAEAAQRVAGLTQAEIAQLSERIDSLPAGAGAVEVVLLVILVLLVLELAGAINIFTRI